MNRYIAIVLLGLALGSGAAAEDLAAVCKQAGIALLRPARQGADFELPLLSGGQVSLSGLRGKVVFLNFWATWCPPCRSEMPSLERLYRRYKDKGLAFLAVDLGEDRDGVAAFVRQNAFSFPVAIDPGEAARDYGIRSIPTTFILDREGRAVALAIGGRNWDSPAVFAALDAFLRE